MLVTSAISGSSVLYQNVFFNVQLQFKVPVIFCRILREDPALAGEAWVGGCIGQMFYISLSLSHFSADMSFLHLDGTVSRSKRIACEMSLLFLDNRWLL